MDWHLLGLVGLVVLLTGVCTPFWTAAGLLRALSRVRTRPAPSRIPAIDPGRVAVLIAAHDEEVVLPTTLRSAMGQVPREQVFVVSDGSTDATGEVARRFGVQALDLMPNRGKAGALSAAIAHFSLVERFDVVLLLDADTVLDVDYLRTGLPLFDAEDVVAVAGTAATNPDPGPGSRVGRVLVAYRERVYVVVQHLQKFGQAARAANVVTIVPGFASMYRSRILPEIDITARGLTIEDFNMTFEVHAKRLGRIAFHPHAAIAYTQDPDTVREYTRQVGRWSLGFWQTVIRHRWRPDRFWAALSVFIVELVVGSAVALLVVPAVLISALGGVLAAVGLDPSGAGAVVAEVLPLPLLLAGALLPDYVLTVIAAVIARRPAFLLLGLLFPLVRLLDALVCLRRLPMALLSESDGAWTSPSRRGPAAAASSAEGAAVPATSAVH